MRKIRKALAALLALVLAAALCAGACAEGWQAAEENGPRFRTLFDAMKAVCDKPAEGNRAAVQAAADAIREANADDGDIAQAVADHWLSVFSDSYRMLLHHGEEMAVELTMSGPEFSGKHAFVVLGFRLEDGEMTEELEERCDAAAACARSFPDAILVCTGGATGENNPDGHTEAGEMKKYLCLHCGIDATRILTEENAMTTLENARNTMGMLIQAGVESITIVTSDYHQRWSQALYNALAAIEKKNSGYEIRIVGNYSCPVENESYPVYGAALSQLAAISEFGIEK